MYKEMKKHCYMKKDMAMTTQFINRDCNIQNDNGMIYQYKLKRKGGASYKPLKTLI